MMSTTADVWQAACLISAGLWGPLTLARCRYMLDVHVWDESRLILRLPDSFLTFTMQSTDYRSFFSLLFFPFYYSSFIYNNFFYLLFSWASTLVYSDWDSSLSSSLVVVSCVRSDMLYTRFRHTFWWLPKTHSLILSTVHFTGFSVSQSWIYSFRLIYFIFFIFMISWVR